MWVFGDIVFLAAMVGVVWAWMLFEDARTDRLDARLDREERERREEGDRRAELERGAELERSAELERRELSRSRDG